MANEEQRTTELKTASPVKLQTQQGHGATPNVVKLNHVALDETARLWMALENAGATVQAEQVKKLGAEWFGDDEFGKAVVKLVEA
ncbi:hypothetical protein LTR56_011056 [Elasticomyces elasticus]|nr:hypothetical protein LTR56_011056 [Elasticomyces elasticus]KAK3655023.1 hypothetical protein LTR22_010491 [Elasticomyces elasticus]KAK4914068.1 hypothetical protein LTR49_017685 [Elasticomyces elasticus]KAK4944794.1 hypothetical protein LTR10_015965 [Elasticomyces elasticus]KAK4974582.1 hypothetical protein LTR42_005227 [Elasticomyces elasticus]